MPLLERVRVEVYLPDLLSSEYQNMLRAFDEELTDTFGGASIIRGLEVLFFRGNDMNILFCFFILLAGCFMQDKPNLPTDFPTLQKVSIEELELKTRGHVEAWGLDKIDRWDLNQETGELSFSFADGIRAVARAQIIGTYNSEDQTWLWAWANSSVDEQLKKDAQKVREYGEKHRIERLTKSKWKGTEKDAWAMAALAVKLCEAQGAYLGPAGKTYVFISFGEITLSKK